jgi:hypothetical protein
MVGKILVDSINIISVSIILSILIALLINHFYSFSEEYKNNIDDFFTQLNMINYVNVIFAILYMIYILYNKLSTSNIIKISPVLAVFPVLYTFLATNIKNEMKSLHSVDVEEIDNEEHIDANEKINKIFKAKRMYLLYSLYLLYNNTSAISAIIGSTFASTLLIVNINNLNKEFITYIYITIIFILNIISIYYSSLNYSKLFKGYKSNTDYFNNYIEDNNITDGGFLSFIDFHKNLNVRSIYLKVIGIVISAFLMISINQIVLLYI